MILQAKGLVKSFKDEKVLNGIDLILDEGKIYGLVGRNGSGKTTLLKILANIYQKDGGDFKILGKTYKEDKNVIENLVFLPDNFSYFDYTSVERMADYYGILYENFDRDFFDREIKKNKINPKKTLRSFSKGYKKLIGFLAVIATNTKIVLLDEILDGMDVLNKEEIISYILDMKDQNRTVFASSHELEEISKIADKSFYLTKEGWLLDTNKKSSEFIKVQIVVKEKLDKELLKDSILRFKLGRVYLLLMENKKDIRKILDENKDIVQYDILEPKLEDSFYWERGKDEKL